MKLFLDTDVLIDFFSGQAPHGDDAQRLALLDLFEDAELWVSPKSFTDIFYVLKKYRASAGLQKSLLESMKLLKTCSLDGAYITSACELGWQDFEDALIEIAAQKVQADYLITRDKGFSQSAIETLTVKQVFEMMAEKGYSYATIDLNASPGPS